MEFQHLKHINPEYIFEHSRQDLFKIIENFPNFVVSFFMNNQGKMERVRANILRLKIF